MAITKLKYWGNDGRFGKITREEILKNSKKISALTFKRFVDNESWRYLSELLGYQINSRSGVTMLQDQYIEYYRSYFIHHQTKLRIYVFFIRQSSNNHYFKI